VSFEPSGPSAAIPDAQLEDNISDPAQMGGVPTASLTVPRYSPTHVVASRTVTQLLSIVFPSSTHAM
jgi:hypothetical protein